MMPIMASYFITELVYVQFDFRIFSLFNCKYGIIDNYKTI